MALLHRENVSVKDSVTKFSWVQSLSYSMTIAEAIINNHKALDWHLNAFRPPSGVFGVQKLSFFGGFLGEPIEVDMLIDA